MLHLFDAYALLFQAWRVVSYEQDGAAYALQVTAVLRDGSRLEIREYFFPDGGRKYAYHWMGVDGSLRCRWDNAPHWPEIATAPHHVHLPGQARPAASIITTLEDLLQFLVGTLETPPARG